jgi:hypothetical protein
VAPHLAFPSTLNRNSQGVRLGPSSLRIRRNCGATVRSFHRLHTHRAARSEASGSRHSTISITSSGSTDKDAASAPAPEGRCAAGEAAPFFQEKHCSAASSSSSASGERRRGAAAEIISSQAQTRHPPAPRGSLRQLLLLRKRRSSSRFASGAASGGSARSRAERLLLPDLCSAPRGMVRW